MQSQAKTVAAYLKELPEDRRLAISAIRKVILQNLQAGFEEGMQYGMIGYYVPHSLYPAGYHCDPKQPLPYAALASQKNYMSLYLMGCYGNEGEENWVRDQFKQAGKKLDMGKSCIRFKKLEDLPLEVIGEAFRRNSVANYIARFEAAIAQNVKDRAERKAQAPTKIVATHKTTVKKAAVKKKSS